MGLLTEGSPLGWEETSKHAEHVRKHGIKQFIHQYNRLKQRKKDVLYWGDEVEYMLVKFNAKDKRAQLTLKAGPLITVLQEMERLHPDINPTAWRPEYGAYMVEGTPGHPYGGLMAHFNMVEANMKLRREEVQKLLDPDEVPLSLTVFPRIGCDQYTSPEYLPTPAEGVSKSIFIPDEHIFGEHPRYRTLTRNIRERRKEKVVINIPIFQDKNTPRPFVEDYSAHDDGGESQRAALVDHIYMDTMAFGMGCSCLQVTFQACNISEARSLYDQLTPLCPIMLALSAAGPLYRGYVSDNDCRWTVISQSVDDRTAEERGLQPLKENKFRINKSRYDSIDSYLSPEGCCYNDIDLVYDREICQELQEAGIDELLARHIAHLFIRDPISLFSEKINQNDAEDFDHFENIQSTNWQTMRFKPPPPNSDIGWRVEFRPMEVQLSDYENAAYTVFIVLLTRVILTYKLNFLIPISKVDENMKTAHERDAVRQAKFYFRKDFTTELSPADCIGIGATCDRTKCSNTDEEYTLMTINEIINGNDDFAGLIPLINNYLDSTECDVDTRCTVLQYLSLISKRASGELMTTSRWIRQFVASHPDYKQDSVISQEINYDLLKIMSQFSQNEIELLDLVADHSSKTVDKIPDAMSKAEKLHSKTVNSVVNGSQ